MPGIYTVWAAFVLAAATQQAAAFTRPDQLEAIINFRDAVMNRSDAWRSVLSTWTCPTPSNSSNSSCDPCGWNVYWGNWQHVGCRGRGTDEAHSTLANDGYITNIHLTDYHITGYIPEAFCDLKYLKEFDVDGGDLTGTLQPWIATCFPGLDELDLSFNELTGTLPAWLGTLNVTQLEVEENQMSGSVPAEIGDLRKLNTLKLSDNTFSGPLPANLRKVVPQLETLLLAGNDFSGDLSVFAQAPLALTSTADNPRLCGMVPQSIRWAHGYNPFNTSLGKPCP